MQESQWKQALICAVFEMKILNEDLVIHHGWSKQYQWHEKSKVTLYEVLLITFTWSIYQIHVIKCEWPGQHCLLTTNIVHVKLKNACFSIDSMCVVVEVWAMGVVFI